jgi:plasmid maintenance system antidote protein VapI
MACINLRVEMVKRRVSIEDIAELFGIHRNSVANKLNGISSFTIDESVKIQEKYFPESELKYLFSKEEGG